MFPMLEIYKALHFPNRLVHYYPEPLTVLNIASVTALLGQINLYWESLNWVLRIEGILDAYCLPLRHRNNQS